MSHSSKPHELSRRKLLKVGAGGAIGGLIASDPDSLSAQRNEMRRDVYKELGLKPVINAAGTITTLGGSLMPPTVIEAWTGAASAFVDLLELQDRVGEKIAKLLGVESALVTTGAAGAIMVGSAAAVTVRDRALVRQLPLPPEMGIEVIHQKSHRACYDNLVKTCGVRMVEVETREELERAIGPKTAMMFSYNIYETKGKIKSSEWIEVARKRGVPTLLDAAADTPPVEALWKYNRDGYDMVAFSGGKAILGPQDTGLLLGRKDLIEAAKLNTSPHCANIGRGLKVSKEDMVAMWAAIDRFVHLDHEREQRVWDERIRVIESAVKGLPTVTTKRVVPPIANHVPHVLVFWDQEKIRITHGKLRTELRQGDPSIATAQVYDFGDGGFLVSVFLLKPGEDALIGARLREILQRAAG